MVRQEAKINIYTTFAKLKKDVKFRRRNTGSAWCGKWSQSIWSVLAEWRPEFTRKSFYSCAVQFSRPTDRHQPTVLCKDARLESQHTMGSHIFQPIEEWKSFIYTKSTTFSCGYKSKVLKSKCAYTVM